MNQRINLIFALSLTLAGFAAAQDSTKTTEEKIATVEGKVDGLSEDYLATKATVDGLSKLKFSGYIQGQWQHADTNGTSGVAGVGAVSGGAFPGTSNQRLQLRRVRLKATYDAGTSKYIMEFEARPNAGNVLSNSAAPGFIPTGVSLKDAEVVLVEPWLKTFTLDLGLQDRPFGFEIPYSSSLHEAPERSRGEQIVLNGEKDLGVVLGVSPSEKMGLLQYLNLKGGLFTGTAGYNGYNGDEIDSTLDIIGRAGFKAPFNDLNIEIDGGVSYYGGHVLATQDTLYAMKGNALLIDSTGTALTKYKGKTLDRSILGFDAEAYFTIPVVGDFLGGTSLRFEYMAGTTIGTTGNSSPYGVQAGGFSTPSADTVVVPAVFVTDTALVVKTHTTPTAFQPPMAERKFSSWYVTFVQNLGPKFQGVVRYDVYDPNTDVKGSDITGANSKNKLGAADLMYSNLGLGLIYFWDSNVKLTAYYDMITNENSGATTGSLAPFSKDLADNVFTLRAQVKF